VPTNGTLGIPGENGYRNRRTVWTIATQPYAEAHFATFPKKLVEPCILAGTREGEIVLDPFAGSGTVGEVALEHGRSAILIELNEKYIPLIRRRCSTWTMQKGEREGLWYPIPKVKRVLKTKE
jgi:DNA modification methylase